MNAKEISKIDTAKIFGDGKALLGAGEMVKAGRVIGSVEKIISRSIPGGGKYDGLGGVFEATLADGSVHRSGQCFFPASVQSAIADKMKGNDTSRLDLIVTVNAVKSDNAEGFAWSYVPDRMELNADPLSHLREPKEPAVQAKGKK